MPPRTEVFSAGAWLPQRWPPTGISRLVLMQWRKPKRQGDYQGQAYAIEYPFCCAVVDKQGGYHQQRARRHGAEPAFVAQGGFAIAQFAAGKQAGAEDGFAQW